MLVVLGLGLGTVLVGCKLDPLSQHLDSSSEDAGQTADSLFWHEVGTLPDASTGKCPGPPFSEKVTPGGRATAIAVDPKTGAVHILHHLSKPEEDAIYSVKDSTGWHTETLMSEGLVGIHNSIGLAPDGTVHAVFADLVGGTLVHGIKAPASKWTLAAIDDAGDNPNDLVVDKSGRLHLVAYDKPAHAVIYLRYEQGAWQQPVVLESELPVLSKWPSIAVKDDRVHVTCVDKAGRLVYRSGTTSGAFDPREVLDSGPLEDLSSMVAVDEEGDVHVIYNHSLKQTLRYIGQSGGTGTFGTSLKLADINTVAASSFGLFADLVILQGEPAVVYSDDNHLLSVKRHDGIWLKPDVVGFCCGSQISAAVGPKGALHIAHWETLSEELRYTKVCP